MSSDNVNIPIPASVSTSSGDSVYDESLDPRRSPPASDAGIPADHPARYAFAQAFGERSADGACHFQVQESDMISAVRFNQDASMVATGDKGGRVVLLRRVNGNNTSNKETPRRQRSAPAPEYRFWTQFQSHEPEFDYLKSTEIDEKINQIRWCREINGSQRLLATNDKTIKLWKVYEKEVKQVVSMSPATLSSTSQDNGNGNGNSTNSNSNSFGINASTIISPTAPRDCNLSLSERDMKGRYEKYNTAGLLIPKLTKIGQVISATPRKVYSNSHAYHINSISLSSDEETFLSADDLRINVWNLTRGGVGFNVVDIKPENMDDLTEVITSAEFHPSHCHLFMHSSSRGNVKLCDLRANALCDNWVKEFEDHSVSGTVTGGANGNGNSSRTSFFSEIIASISDIKFSPNGRYILTRDYMNMKLWDINMENQPLLNIPVQETLRNQLAEMYENDCIFDKFRCAFSHDGSSLLTGGYGSLFQSFSALNGQGAAVEATVDFVSGLSGRGQIYCDGDGGNAATNGNGMTANARNAMLGDVTDQTKKILHMDAAPEHPIAAVAAGPALYMYYVPT